MEDRIAIVVTVYGSPLTGERVGREVHDLLSEEESYLGLSILPERQLIDYAEGREPDVILDGNKGESVADILLQDE